MLHPAMLTFWSCRGMRKSIRKGLRIYLQKKLVSLLFKIKRNRILFLEIDILKMKNAYDIMPLGKRRNYIHNNAPPFRTCIRGGSLAIVSCLGLFVY